MKRIAKRMVNYYIKHLANKKNRTANENAIWDSMIHPTNYVDKKYIDDLVAYAKNLGNISL